MLRFEGLEKHYGGKTVFSGLAYQFEAGCHALQSPNGSGKSTLLGMLAGVVATDGGEVRISGASLQREPLQAKARLAYVPDACPIYPFMTGREFLALVASAKHCSLGPDTLERVTRLGLDPHLDIRVEQMSLGTQKKLMLSASSIGDPAVIIADEPSIAIDDTAREVLIEYFVTASRHRVVLFSTHDDSLAQACGARVVTMSDLAEHTKRFAGSLGQDITTSRPAAGSQR